MQTAIIKIFCEIDDFIKHIHYRDHTLSEMNTSEVMLVGVIAWYLFSGNIERSRIFLSEHRYILNMLSKSRLNRRLHKIPKYFWLSIYSFLKTSNEEGFIIDSFPVPVCSNVRSSRRRLLMEKEFIGYNASKKTWITGVKVHVLSNVQGQIKQILITPASKHDLSAFREFEINRLPKPSVILGDKAYGSLDLEESLAKKRIYLIAERKMNSRRGQCMLYHHYGRKIRKRIETTFSKIESWLPKSIHAVTSNGFYLKVMMLMVAYGLS